MATTPPVPPSAQPDPDEPRVPHPDTVSKTISWIHRQRQLYRFVIRGLQRQQAILLSREREARVRLAQFDRRMDTELERYPEAFGVPREDEAD